MIIGLSTVELYLPGLNSLKEKRNILKSIKTLIRNRFNVGISEIDYQDKWQHTLLGIVGISNDRVFMENTLKKIITNIKKKRGVNILDYVIEVDYGIKTKENKFTYNGNRIRNNRAGN